MLEGYDYKIKDPDNFTTEQLTKLLEKQRNSYGK